MSAPERHLPCSAETALAAVSEAAELWGADWQPTHRGGRLRLPVVHGLRHGVLTGKLETETKADGATLRFEIESSRHRVNRSALVVLLFGAAGGVTLILWPISPALLQLAPIGVVLLIIAWLMVVSRLRNSDSEDFFDLVANLIERES